MIGLRIQHVYLRFIAYRIINIVFNVFQKCCLFIQSHLYIYIYIHDRRQCEGRLNKSTELYIRQNIIIIIIIIFITIIYR